MAKIATLILLVIKMHIRLTRFLENSTPTANYNSKKRLYGGSKGFDWDDNKQIDKAVANAENNKNKAEDP